MERELVDTISYISLYSVIIPLLIGLFKFKDLNPVQRLIGLLVLVTILGEIGGHISANSFKNNLPVIHLFTVLQFIVFVFIMEKGLYPFFSKKQLRGLIIAFVIFALMDAFYWNGIYNFNNYSRPLSSFILLILALCFFYKTLKELKIKHLELVPLFWLSIGILLYHSGSLLIFLFTNYMKTSNAELLTLWGIHAIFNIILNLSYSIALWINPPK